MDTIIKRLFVFSLLITSFTGLSTPVLAAGMFDELDYCIAAKKEYNATRDRMLSQVRYQIDNAYNESEPNAQFKALWWKEKEAAMRSAFITKYSQYVSNSGGNIELAFQHWLRIEGIPNNGGTPALEEAMREEYYRLYILEKEREYGATKAELDETKRELYGHCKPDVANQIVRASGRVLSESVKLATAPVRIFHGNWQAARNERGEGAKIIRGTTGISVDAIRKHGLAGGPNSVVNEIGRGFSKVFGW